MYDVAESSHYFKAVVTACTTGRQTTFLTVQLPKKLKSHFFDQKVEHRYVMRYMHSDYFKIEIRCSRCSDW
jgi:hypothetical protein